jgi:glycosyltransferase involved in cell wall biosynthesis
MGFTEKIIVINEFKKGGISTFVKSSNFNSEDVLDLSKLSRTNNPIIKIFKAILIVYREKPKLLVCVEDLPSVIGFFYIHSKVIVNIHRNPDLNYSRFKGFFFKILYKYLFSKNVRFIGVSKDQSNSLSKIINRKVKYCYTVFKIKKRNLISYEYKSITFLIASRLEPEKGINEAISYFLHLKKILNSSNIKASLKIYGNFKDENFRIDLLNKINFIDSIIYVGEFSQVEELVTHASPVFLNFSHHEGFGLINWEMIDLGVPSIIYNCDYGVSELITPKFNHSKFGPKLINSFVIREDEVNFVKSLATDVSFYFRSSQNSLICSDEFRLKALNNNINCFMAQE